MKQFRKKDYKFRHDLGGLCIGYNMDWITNEDGTFPSEYEEDELAWKHFHKLAEELNEGEYFSIEIFGNKAFAYRDSEGLHFK